MSPPAQATPVPETAVSVAADRSTAQGAPEEAAPPPAGAGSPPDQTPAATAARLAELFPALFGPGATKPLKLRIQADIQQRAPGVFTRKALSVFLHRHTTSTAYLKALVVAATRFDLDGEPAGELIDEHRDAATAELARRQEIVRARRAAEREAQRQGRGPARPVTAGNGAPAVPSADAARPPRRGRAVGPGPGAGRPPRGPRPGERPAREARGGHDGRDGGRPPRRDEAGRRAGPGPADARAVEGAAAPTGPVDEAQRQRALLLRAWEGSPLTKANFCTLKRLTEAEFDAQIAQAQAERAARR